MQEMISMKSFKELAHDLVTKVDEDAPANATGSAVVGTGDNPVHWKDNKKTTNILFSKNSPFRRKKPT